MIPFITCAIPFGQKVCELVLGVKIIDLDLGVQVNSVEQPVKSNSVGSRHMSHCRTSAFGNHLYYSLVVFKDVQRGTLMWRFHVWGNKLDIRQLKTFLGNGVSFWELLRFSDVLSRNRFRRASWFLCVWLDFECNTSITKSQRSSAENQEGQCRSWHRRKSVLRITADTPILTSVKVEGEPRKSLQDLSLRLISLVRFRLIPPRFPIDVEEGEKWLFQLVRSYLRHPTGSMPIRWGLQLISRCWALWRSRLNLERDTSCFQAGLLEGRPIPSWTSDWRWRMSNVIVSEGHILPLSKSVPIRTSEKVSLEITSDESVWTSDKVKASRKSHTVLSSVTLCRIFQNAWFKVLIRKSSIRACSSTGTLKKKSKREIVPVRELNRALVAPRAKLSWIWAEPGGTWLESYQRNQAQWGEIWLSPPSTFWPSSKWIGNRGGIRRNRTDEIRRFAWQHRVAFSRCIDLVRSQYGLIRCILHHWPSLMSWSALTLSEVRCDLLKQSRLSFFRVIRKSMTESGGLPEVQLESTLCLLRGSALTFTEVNIDLSDVAFAWSALTLSEVRLWPSDTITFHLLKSQSGIERNQAESYQRNQAQWKILQGFSRFTLHLHRGQFRRISCYPPHWPSPMSWSALTFLVLRAWSLGFGYWCVTLKIESDTQKSTGTAKPVAWQHVREAQEFPERDTVSKESLELSDVEFVSSNVKSSH